MKKKRVPVNYMFTYEYSTSERSSSYCNTMWADPVVAWKASRGVGWYGSHGSLQAVKITSSAKDCSITIEHVGPYFEYHEKFNVFTKMFDSTHDVVLVKHYQKELNLSDEEFVVSHNGYIYLCNTKTFTFKRCYDLNNFNMEDFK